MKFIARWLQSLAGRKRTVVIVAKTRLSSGFCFGGLDVDDGRHLRLRESGGQPYFHDTPYRISQAWEMKFRKWDETEPPHVEDVAVHFRKCIGGIEDLKSFLLETITPWEGGPESLFEGLLKVGANGRGYLARSSLPSGSVGYWIPDGDLVFNDAAGGKSCYRYKGSGGAINMPYVGCEPPPPKLPAGSLLRVSLARWWRPENHAEAKERCHLQLSGWY